MIPQLSLVSMEVAVVFILLSMLDGLEMPYSSQWGMERLEDTLIGIGMIQLGDNVLEL